MYEFLIFSRKRKVGILPNFHFLKNMIGSYTKILKSNALIQKVILYINVRTFIYMEMKYDAGYFKNYRDKTNWKYNSLQKNEGKYTY